MIQDNNIIKQGECEFFYRLGRTIGQGTFAIVKIATNRETHDNYAIKIMKKDAIPTSTYKHIKEEVDILQNLHHPHIVSLYEVIEGKNNICFIMELMNGGELFDRIVEKEKYSEIEAKSVLRQILSAVQYFHSLDIVHRDVKPENLLYLSSDENSPIKVADFGLATLLKPSESLNLFCGTPTYLSPEQVSSSGYGKPVDLWAIGVITYVVLSGYPPFYDDNMMELFHKIKLAKVSFTRHAFIHVSDEAKDFISKLLEIDPNKRLTADQALSHPWLKSSSDVNQLHDDMKPLIEAKSNLREFNARRRLKSIVHVIQAAQFLRKPSPIRNRDYDNDDISCNSHDNVQEMMKFKRFPPTALTTTIAVKDSQNDLISPTDSVISGATTSSSKSTINDILSFPPTPNTPDLQSYPMTRRGGNAPHSSFSPVFGTKPLPVIIDTLHHHHMNMISPSEAMLRAHVFVVEDDDDTSLSSTTPSLPPIQSSSSWMMQPTSHDSIIPSASDVIVDVNIGSVKRSFSTENHHIHVSTCLKLESPEPYSHSLQLVSISSTKSSPNLSSSSADNYSPSLLSSGSHMISSHMTSLPAIDVVRKKSTSASNTPTASDFYHHISRRSLIKHHSTGVITSLSVDTSSSSHADANHPQPSPLMPSHITIGDIQPIHVRRSSKIDKISSSRSLSSSSMISSSSVLSEENTIHVVHPKSGRKPLDDLPSPSNNRNTHTYHESP